VKIYPNRVLGVILITTAIRIIFIEKLKKVFLPENIGANGAKN
jgi:hypothetical protein